MPAALGRETGGFGKSLGDFLLRSEVPADTATAGENTGEKIVYSRGLPQFFISDIMDEDVICTMGEEEQKLLLFDRFTCWDEGCYIGEVSKEVIAQMPKCN